MTTLFEAGYITLYYRKDNYIRSLAVIIGEVLEVDSDGVGENMSARVKVMMNVCKPLRRIQRFSNKERKVSMVEIKYERLPTFCYAYGSLGHIERDCERVLGEKNRGEIMRITVDITIDGTHLYEKYKVTLLIAMGTYTNFQLFQLAFDVVEEESTDS